MIGMTAKELVNRLNTGEPLRVKVASKEEANKLRNNVAVRKSRQDKELRDTGMLDFIMTFEFDYDEAKQLVTMQFVSKDEGRMYTVLEDEDS